MRTKNTNLMVGQGCWKRKEPAGRKSSRNSPKFAIVVKRKTIARRQQARGVASKTYEDASENGIIFKIKYKQLYRQQSYLKPMSLPTFLTGPNARPESTLLIAQTMPPDANALGRD